MVCRLRAMSASSHWRRIDAALIAFACVGFAVPAWGQDAAGAAPSLSAVCIGRVTQEQRTTVAVHWSGADPVEIVIWEDLDGDGAPDDDEPLLATRRVALGVDTLEIDAVPRKRVLIAAFPLARSLSSSAIRSIPLPSCGWSTGFFAPGISGTVHALAKFDDGTGPALFVGGKFTSASATNANHIAKWDGARWTALNGPNGNGVDGEVRSLHVFDDGNGAALYVGGSFTAAGGVPASGIARWNGLTFSPLPGLSGNGVQGTVRALTSFDDGRGSALYAGGAFSSAGGVTANSIARWTLNGWSALTDGTGNGVDGTVDALSAFDDGSGPALFVAGSFSLAGGRAANSIAKWNGSAWMPLSGPSGTGVSGSIHALAVFDDGTGAALFAAGEFYTAGGIPAHSFAKWNGVAWQAPTGVSEMWINSLVTFTRGEQTSLIAGGFFWYAGSTEVRHIAQWDGRSWRALAGPSGTGTNDEVHVLAALDDGLSSVLLAGGSFTTAGGSSANGIAKWDGSSWSALPEVPGHGLNGRVLALAVHNDGSGNALFAGGTFTTAGSASANYIAKWNGSEWLPLSSPGGNGVSFIVTSLAVFDDGTGKALFAGGRFTRAGGLAAQHIAKWDGVGWSRLAGSQGDGVDGYVEALATYDDGTGEALYVGGYFVLAGGTPANSIAKWSGTAWSPLPGQLRNGVGGIVYALAGIDQGPDSTRGLYVGGWFMMAGDVEANHVARWKDGSWSALFGPTEPGVNLPIHALATFDDGSGRALYAGGEFTKAGGTSATHLARWDGASWAAVGTPPTSDPNDRVYALAALEDGTERALYVGGRFFGFDGVKADYLARWDGAQWSDLSGPGGTALDDEVRSLSIFEDSGSRDIFAGGLFSSAGGIPATHIARWRCLVFLLSDGFESGSLSTWSAALSH